MADISVTVPFPTFEVNCPACEASLEVYGDEYKPMIGSIHYGKFDMTCDHCDTDFTVYLGD